MSEISLRHNKVGLSSRVTSIHRNSRQRDDGGRKLESVDHDVSYLRPDAYQIWWSLTRRTDTPGHLSTFMPYLRGLKLPRSPLRRSHSSWPTLHAVRARNAPIDLHPEVEDALAHNQPVVALETALVTHGLPYPQSLDVPLMLEDVVRSTGAVPATIGILGGRVKVGLARDELDRLAGRKAGAKLAKVSRRDIAAALATGSDGGGCSGWLGWPSATDGGLGN
jgi:hypothetical protein